MSGTGRYREPQDDVVDAELVKLLYSMTLYELERYCYGTLRAATQGQRVLKQRYPDAWEYFDRAVELGEII